MITKPKQKSPPVLIKELDTVFSEWVRLNESDQSGTVRCFITGEKFWYKDVDAAHFIDRANMITRFDPMNVHAVSRDSNRYDPNHLAEYSIAMCKKYSKTDVEFLIYKSKSSMKFTRPELEEMISDYKEKVKQLRKVKGL